MQKIAQEELKKIRNNESEVRPVQERFEKIKTKIRFKGELACGVVVLVAVIVACATPQ